MLSRPLPKRRPRVPRPALRSSHATRPGGPGRHLALISIPGIEGGVDEILALKLAIVSLALAAIAAAWLALRQWLALREARRARIEAERRSRAARALLGAVPLGFWLWPAGADANPLGVAGQGLAALLGVDDSALATFDDVTRLFEPAAADSIATSARRLRESGASFTVRAATGDGKRHFEFRGLRAETREGTPVADTVWVRDVTETAIESARMMERYTALAAQNTDYRHVFDRLRIPVWVRGPDLAIVYCNQAYAEAVDEPTPAQAVAREVEISGGPVGWGKALAEEALRAGGPITRSAHLVVGGARRLLEVTEMAIGGPDSAWRVAGFAIDRTETDEARAELARHIAAHGDVLESLGTGIIVYGADTRVEFFNTSFARMWGLDSDWLHSHPTHGEVLEDLRARRVVPDQVDFRAFKQERIELYTSLLEAREELLSLPDGRSIRMVVNPHPLGGLLMTFEDVTDRLALERNYNTLIAVQTETLDNLHEGVAVFGSDGRLKLHNPAFARIWKLGPLALQGEPRVSDIVEAAKPLMKYDGDWDSFRERVIAGVLDRTPRSARLERTDGSTLDFSSVPLPDGAKLFTYIDITDTLSVERALRERNEALVASDRLKSEFITNVSYELRTPLNTIIGFTEILTNQYFGTLNARQAEYTHGILEASRVLLALIDDVLDLAVIDAGQLELELAEVNVAELMDTVMGMVREPAAKHGLAVELDCSPEAGTLVGDARRLRQTLFNLASNAVKFTPRGGRVRLSAAPDGSAVAFAVSDTGKGIPPEDQRRVFERFESGPGGQPRGQGLGVGLPLVKSFVEHHGGTIELSSAVGEGTTVHFTIPREGPGRG